MSLLIFFPVVFRILIRFYYPFNKKLILAGDGLLKSTTNESAASHLLLDGFQKGWAIDIEPSKWQNTREVVRVKDRITRTWWVQCVIDLM